jgi:hypothetical protein
MAPPTSSQVKGLVKQFHDMTGATDRLATRVCF